MRLALIPSLALMLFLSSCGCLFNRLSVQSDYITIENLASLHVNTPDPRQFCPTLGQRLTISWEVEPSAMKMYERLFLAVRVVFRNHEVLTFFAPIHKRWGSYTYSLLNDDYFTKNGILTYKVELWGDETLLEVWQHQIWADIITAKKDTIGEQDCDINHRDTESTEEGRGKKEGTGYAGSPSAAG
jgi:hypothetical protein